MKSLMLLWRCLLFELGDRCHTSTTLDLNKAERRIEHEGESFLTITLPQFGKDFERSLELGYVDRLAFQGFSWSAGLPRFFSGFLSLVFDASSGRLLDDPSIDAIHAVRQLTLMYGKLFKLTTKEKEHAAMRGYVQCEHEVRQHDAVLSDLHVERDDLARVASIVVGRVLHRTALPLRGAQSATEPIQADGSEAEDGLQKYAFHLRNALTPVVPVHGPGATADGLKGNQKWMHDSWTTRLDAVFPMADYMIPSYSYYDSLEEVNLIEPGAEIPVKVIAVPKTQKTPRIIAVEPTVMMFMQKALQTMLYENVKRDYLLNAFIGFTDQEPNQVLACEGSRTGKLATLDLSEASDRVSCLHVEDLCRYIPSMLEAVMAVRSTKADVPGFGVIPISKYASMGSALTFPLEAMVFLSMVFVGIEKELRRPLTRRDLYGFVGKVRVFGDDIIVPVDYVDSVISTLELYGLKVNRKKSFWTGKFRESCGKEYYDGTDVSIVRVRHDAPSSLTDAKGIISWVDMSNQFYKAGLWQTVKWLDSFMSGILKDYPVVAETSPVLGRLSFCGYESQRTGGRYQSPLVKGWVVSSVIPRNSLDDHYALLKWFSLRGDLPIADEKHLERSGRPFVVDIKRRWAQPY